MKKQGKSTEKTIDIFNKEEIEYWCDKLNCEKKILLNAILTAGKSVKEVKRFLNLSKKKKK